MPYAESFFQSRQQFQIILLRKELLVDDLKIEPKPSLETVEKHLVAMLATMKEYTEFLSNLQRSAKSEEKERLTEN